jgi:hypothetical protein
MKSHPGSINAASELPWGELIEIISGGVFWLVFISIAAGCIRAFLGFN